jgi:predicted DNA-binding transcriptional regulator AlpA
MDGLKTVAEPPAILRFVDSGKDFSAVATLLWTAAKTAQSCGVSERTWRTWDGAGYIPAAVEIGRSKFWRPEEVKAWVTAGCPRRAKWKVLRE